ncbi:MAG: glycosyltransferase family 2 protein [Clostridia bacterium]
MISIIVPVYNVQDYLAECIHSIFAQTYRELEIILVDDGSTDESGQMCDAYALRDSRVRVIHKPNGGLADARNVGFSIFQGEFVTCVDSDDFIDPRALETQLNTLLASEADIVVSGIQQFSCEKLLRVSSPPRRICTAEEAISLLLSLPGYMNPLCNKLFRRELLHGVQCKPYAAAEDFSTTCQALHRARRIALIPDVLYHYRIRANSIITAPFNLKRLDSLQSFDDTSIFIRAWYPGFEEQLGACEARFALSLLGRVVTSPKRYPEVERMLVERVRKNRRALHASASVPRAMRLADFSLRLGLPFYRMAWMLYQKLFDA